MYRLILQQMSCSVQPASKLYLLPHNVRPMSEKKLLDFLSDQCYDQMMIGNRCVHNTTPLVTLVQCEEISVVTAFGKCWTFRTVVLVL